MHSESEQTSSNLTSRVMPIANLSQSDIAAWRELTRQSPSLASPFLSYPYAAAAAQIFSHVHVSILSRNGSPVGFFPFQHRSRMHLLLGWGERLGGEMSDYFGVVAAPDIRLSGRKVLELSRLKALYFSHLHETQANFGLTGEQPETGLRIALPEGGRAYWELLRSRDKKFVTDTERRERKLAEAHGPLNFVFRTVHSDAQIDHVINAKRRQYTQTGVSDCLQHSSSREFLRILAKSQDPDCHGTLSTLHSGDVWIASHFGLTFGDTLHYWFPVYNPEMRAFAPGRLLLKAIILGSDEHGIRLVDRGSGDSSAKQDFATEKQSFFRGVWSSPGLSSLAFRANLSLRWRLQVRTELAQLRNRPSAEA